MDHSIVFSRWRQRVPLTSNGSLHSPSRHLNSLIHFRTTHATYSLYFTVGQETPQNCPILRGSGSRTETRFHGPTRVHIPNDISIGTAVVEQLMTYTQTHTCYATPVAVSRIFVPCACNECCPTTHADTCLMALYPELPG